jgi:predicted MFS family arabinose efflux permease
MQAYLGDRVGYAQRGLAIAATEIGWSSAFLLGMPVVGWLISRGGWTAPFPWLLACTLAALAVLAAWLPSDGPRDTKGSSVGRHVRAVLRHPAAVGGLALSALLSFANETVSIVYGVWMEGRFGLQVAALGAASAVIGIAELGGEGLVAALADRLGKRRAVALGILLNALAALALPRIATSTITALLALFAFYLTFEFTVVSVLPLMTELVPAARATMMAANLAAFSLGRSLGALSGPRLYAGGMAANVAVAAVLNAAALVILIVLVREEPDIRPIDA